MNDFDALPPHPWLAELAADPHRALADLLTGRIDKSPYARLSDAEFLLQVLRDDRPDERAALETALLAWLEARRREPWQIRARYGLPVYVAAVLEALNAIQMLELKRAAHHLDELHNTYLRWFEPLRLGNAADPALELWRCHALLPGDSAHHLADWLRFSVDAGQTRPATYLTVALQGLRDLPTGNDANANLRYALHALAQRYLARRGSDSNAANELRQYHASVRLAYPRAPQTWREVWEDALGGLKKDQADAVRAEIEGGKAGATPEKAPKGAPRLDPGRFPGESRALAADLKARKPVETLWPRIEKLFNDSLAYCRASGDSDYFVRSLCNLGSYSLRLSPTPKVIALEILNWIKIALEWERDNSHVWILWARCLEDLGNLDQCELVYWEIRRYFPDDPSGRRELARLLRKQGRKGDVELLLFEQIERIPLDYSARIELSDVLSQPDRQVDELISLLRDAYYADPENVVAKNELIKFMLMKSSGQSIDIHRWKQDLLRRLGEHSAGKGLDLRDAILSLSSEQESLLRTAISLDPHNPIAKIKLAKILLLNHQDKKAEQLLLTTRNEFPTNKVPQLELILFYWHSNQKEKCLLEIDIGLKTFHVDSEFKELAAKLFYLVGDAAKAREVLDSIVAPDELEEIEFSSYMADSMGNNQPSNGKDCLEGDSSIGLPFQMSDCEVSSAITARAAFLMAHDEAAGREELQARLTADPDDQLAAFFLAWRGAAPDLPELPQAWGLRLADAWRAPREADWAELAQTFPHRRRLTWALRWLAGLRDGVPLADADWQRLEKFAATPESRPAPGEDLVARWVNTAGRDGAGLPGKPEALAEELVALTFYRDLSPVASFH